MYKDRGIIKWQPFDALRGYHDIINNHQNNKLKIDRPVLLEDKLNELDYILKEVYRKTKEVLIKYYDKGFIKTTLGIITEIDILNKKITISNHLKISVFDIYDIIK